MPETPTSDQVSTQAFPSLADALKLVPPSAKAVINRNDGADQIATPASTFVDDDVALAIALSLSMSADRDDDNAVVAAAAADEEEEEGSLTTSTASSASSSCDEDGSGTEVGAATSALSADSDPLVHARHVASRTPTGYYYNYHRTHHYEEEDEFLSYCEDLADAALRSNGGRRRRMAGVRKAGRTRVPRETISSRQAAVLAAEGSVPIPSQDRTMYDVAFAIKARRKSEKKNKLRQGRRRRDPAVSGGDGGSDRAGDGSDGDDVNASSFEAFRRSMWEKHQDIIVNGDLNGGHMNLHAVTAVQLAEVNRGVQDRFMATLQRDARATPTVTYHGTPDVNYGSIMARGLITGGTQGIPVAHSQVYGPGVYSTLTKRHGFDYGNGRMLVCAVLDNAPPASNGQVVSLRNPVRRFGATSSGRKAKKNPGRRTRREGNHRHTKKYDGVTDFPARARKALASRVRGRRGVGAGSNFRGTAVSDAVFRSGELVCTRDESRIVPLFVLSVANGVRANGAAQTAVRTPYRGDRVSAAAAAATASKGGKRTAQRAGVIVTGIQGLNPAPTRRVKEITRRLRDKALTKSRRPSAFIK